MDKLEKQLQEYRESRPEPAGFVSVDEFKARFKARVEKDVKKPIPFRMFLRVAALVVVVLTALLLLPEVQVNVDGSAGYADVRLQEAVRLFGSDTGVGFVGDELITYQRQSDSTADLLIELSWQENGVARVIQLASGSEDFFEIDGNGFSGAVLVTAGDMRVLSLDLTMQNGASISQDLAFGNGAAIAVDGLQINVRSI